jgi:hypothetical protein
MKVFMDMKFCRICELEKFEDQYYTSNDIVCKRCLLDRDRVKRRNKTISNGGSERVPQKPNTWADETQMEQTQQFLVLLGYKQNKENNVWYKLPWKTKDAEFPLMEKQNNHRGKPTQYSKEQIMEWVELRKKGLTYVKICEMYEVPNKQTIYHYVRKYLDK